MCLPLPLLPKAPPQLAQCNEVGFAGKSLACESIKVATNTSKGNSGDYFFPSLFFCAQLWDVSVKVKKGICNMTISGKHAL